MRVHVEAPGPERSHNRLEVNHKTRSVSVTHPVTPNVQEAEQFLSAVDPTTDFFTFQTVDDVKKRRDPRLARILHGSLADNASGLASLNARGAGVFVCINATDLRGRGTCHVTRVRAIWQDDDYGWQGEFPLIPSLVVSTSPGRFQRVWLCDDLMIDHHRAVQERLATSHGHDRQASDLSRVLRLPGFLHKKNPDAPHFVSVIGGNRLRYSAHQILVAFPPIEMPFVAPSRVWRPRSDDGQRIANALQRIPSNEREVWLRVGMALRNHYGDAGRAVWDPWSATSEKFDLRVQERVWRSFRRGGIGVGTIFHLAGARPDVA